MSDNSTVATPTTGHGAIGEDVREAARNAVRDAVRAAEAAVESAESNAASESAQDEVSEASGTDAAETAENASESQPDPVESVSEPAPETPSKDPEYDRISRERAKAKAIQKDAKAQADSVMSEARAELEKAKAFLAEVSSERDALRAAKEEAAKELERYRKATATLKRDPLKALKELQVDPEDMLTRIAKSGTEEMRTISELDELREALAEERAWRKQFQEEQQAKAKSSQADMERVVQMERENIVRNYIKESEQLDKYPHLNALYGEDKGYLVALGHREADALKAADPNADISPAKLLANIERKAASRRGVSIDSDKVPQKGANKSLPGTLTKSDKTDRYSTISVPDDLEERRRLAREQVKAVVRQGELDGDI